MLVAMFASLLTGMVVPIVTTLDVHLARTLAHEAPTQRGPSDGDPQNGATQTA
jgi:hypothetical protein